MFLDLKTKNDSIQTLNLQNVGLAEFYRNFFTVIYDNKSITNLDISANNLSNVKNPQEIYDAFMENETIIEINLTECFNDIRYDYFT